MPLSKELEERLNDLLQQQPLPEQALEEIIGKGPSNPSNEALILDVLQLAATKGNLPAVEFLLPRVSEEAVARENKALIQAAKFGQLAVVERLLEIKAVAENVSIEDDEALALAARGGHFTVVSYLLQFIENIDEGNGHFAVAGACQNGQVEAVRRLLQEPRILEYVAEENHGDDWSALGWAVGEGHSAVVECLLESTLEWNLDLKSKLFKGEKWCGIPEPKTIYVEKQDDKLEYNIFYYFSPDTGDQRRKGPKIKVKGMLDILIEGELTDEVLNAHKSRILEMILERGHIAVKRYPILEQLAADKEFSILKESLYGYQWEPSDYPTFSPKVDRRIVSYILVEAYKKMKIKLPDWVFEKYNPIKEEVGKIHDVIEALLPCEIGNIILEKAALPRNVKKKSPEERLAQRINGLVASLDKVIAEQTKMKESLEKVKENEFADEEQGKKLSEALSNNLEKLLMLKKSVEPYLERVQELINLSQISEKIKQGEKVESLDNLLSILKKYVEEEACLKASTESAHLPQLIQEAIQSIEASEKIEPLKALSTEVKRLLELTDRELFTKLHGGVIVAQGERAQAILDDFFKRSVVAIEQAQLALKTAGLMARERSLEKETQTPFELMNNALAVILQARVIFKKVSQAISKSAGYPHSILANIEALLKETSESFKVIEEQAKALRTLLGSDEAFFVSDQAPAKAVESSKTAEAAFAEINAIFKQAQALIEHSDKLFEVRDEQDKSREAVIACFSNILGAKASIQMLQAKPDADSIIQEAVQSARTSLNEIQAKLKAVEEAVRAAEEAAKAAEKASRSDLGKKSKEGDRKVALEDVQEYSKLFSVLAKGSMPVERTLADKAYYEPDVPGDGTCLFYSVVFAYLLPVVNDPVLFKARFIKLFGEEVAGSVEDNRKLFLRYDGNSRFIQRHAAVLEVLVNVNFRTRLVDFMRQHRQALSGFVTEAEDFDARLEKMGDPKRREWGDQPEIEAISRFLGVRVTVCQERGKEIVAMGNLGDHGRDYAERLYLVHTAAGKAKSKASIGRNHYHYLVEKQYLPLAEPKELKEAKETKEAKEAKETQEVMTAAKARDAASINADLGDRLKAVQLAMTQASVDQASSGLVLSRSSSSSSFSFSAEGAVREQVDYSQSSVGLALEPSITVGAQSGSSQTAQPAEVAGQAVLKRKQPPVKQDSPLSDDLGALGLSVEDAEQESEEPQSKVRRRHSPDRDSLSRVDEFLAMVPEDDGSMSASLSSNPSIPDKRASLKRKSRFG